MEMKIEMGMIIVMQGDGDWVEIKLMFLGINGPMDRQGISKICFSSTGALLEGKVLWDRWIREWTLSG